MVDLSNTKLLIVDDESEIREILQEILSKVTSNISLAENGAEALRLVKGNSFDTIISDINMPKMTGLQFLAEIRYLGIQVPFLLLTGFADKPNILEALRLDATDFLEKPFDPQQITAVTQQALELGKNLREMDQEIEALFQDSKLPADKLVRLKKLKKVTQGMRIARTLASKKVS